MQEHQTKNQTEKKYPNSEQVKKIYSETYLFYVKYEKQQQVEWESFHKEMLGLSKKYPFDLTKQMLIEIATILEQKEKGRINE